MATELYRPKYSPKGWKYRDAVAADLLQESPHWWLCVRHTASAVCGCKNKDGSFRRGIAHTFRENTKTTERRIALQQLETHKRELAKGNPVGKRSDQPTFIDMATRLRRDYELNAKHKGTLEARLKHLLKAFGNRKMLDITADDIESYKYQRRKECATGSTVNRELAALGRSFSLGLDLGLLQSRPRIHKFKENPARSGFFEADSYVKVMRYLPSNALRLACEIMHIYGWRKSEVMNLQRRHIQFDESQNGTLRLDAGMTKNDDPRIVPLTPALRESIAIQLKTLDTWQLKTGSKTQYLFTHTSGRNEGQRILDFVKSWRTACLEAELEGLEGPTREKRKRELLKTPEGLMKALRHDFRRTAVRNLLNGGTPERVAMKITGHRSANVFKRYHIVNLGDLERAVLRLGSSDLRMLSDGKASESDKAK